MGVVATSIDELLVTLLQRSAAETYWAVPSADGIGVLTVLVDRLREAGLSGSQADAHHELARPVTPPVQLVGMLRLRGAPFIPAGGSYADIVARLQTDAARAARAIRVLLGLAEARELRMSRTKVAKLLYLADLRSISHDGVPGSGVAWQWLKHGPFSDRLLHVENDLVAAGNVARDRTWNWYGKPEYRLTAPTPAAELLDETDQYIAHLDAVLAEHGHLSATELKDLSYETEPMLEAQTEGERGVFLDLGENATLPDISGVVGNLRRHLAELESRDDEDGPAPAGCSEELLIPLQSARAEANRILLAE